MSQDLNEWMCNLMCCDKEDSLYQNIVDYAQYMVDHRCSVRTISKEFDVPKTTMHKYLAHNLKYIDDDLYIQCRNIMKNNKKNRKRDDRGRFI